MKSQSNCSVLLFCMIVAAEVEKLARPILDATSGNPFFVEEVVRELVRGGALTGERGAHRLGVPVSEIAIPSSIQDAIAARVDALPENGKQLVQLASAIGQSTGSSQSEAAPCSTGRGSHGSSPSAYYPATRPRSRRSAALHGRLCGSCRRPVALARR